MFCFSLLSVSLSMLYILLKAPPSINTPPSTTQRDAGPISKLHPTFYIHPWLHLVLCYMGKPPQCWERLRAGGEGAAENEMVGWHHWLNEHESEQTPGDSEGQGSLAHCSPRGSKESDSTLTTEQQLHRLACVLDDSGKVCFVTITENLWWQAR